MAEPDERESGVKGWLQRRKSVLRGELLPPGPGPIGPLSGEQGPSGPLSGEQGPSGDPDPDAATEPMAAVPPGGPTADEPAGPKLLGSSSFFRLWLAQVVSSLGDWLGLVAVLSLAARIGGSSPEAAVGIVMSARMVPGFFFGSVAGVLVDRWDRKRVMVTCDIGRGFVLATLPFIDTVWGLFVASLLLEVFTLLWSPAKEASVPNLVPISRLASANSLSLAAAYGTFPIGSALFASLTKVAEFVGRHAGALDFLELNQESLAIYVDVLTFFTSAALISSLTLPQHARQGGRIELGRTFTELKEGWSFIGTSPVVRSVMIGLGTGLVGGGMVAPLGPTFANQVLNAGPPGFGLLLFALGMGVATGVVGVSTIQQRLPHARLFPLAVLGAGVAMLVAASTSRLGLTMLVIGVMGVCAGAVYVLGFTILQENVEDEMRGRIFATLYTLTRLCLLVALTLAPLAAGLLDRLSNRLFDGEIEIWGATIELQGVRVTLWLGGVIILVAGVLAARTMRARTAAEP
ncbi:MAG: MFS transporter [Actinobacteria bacterium]|nr:MFS transporter [Actinomycetota bacterium]